MATTPKAFMISPLCARAFELGWLLVVLYLEQGQHRPSVEKTVDMLASELGLNLPARWLEEVIRDREGSRFSGLIDRLSKQLRQSSPHAWKYFAAGSRLVFEASDDHLDQAKQTISELNLPSHLREPQKDVFAWVNGIHSYFTDTICSR
jgi:hypothetical protein